MSELWFAVLFTTTVGAALSILIARRLPFAIWSPVYGIPVVYTLIGITGYLYYWLSSDYLGGFYDIGIPPSQLNNGFAGFIWAVDAFLAGAMLYLSSSSGLKLLDRKRNLPAQRSPRLVAVPGASALIILILPLLLTVVGKGVTSVLWRTDYLEEQYHFVLILGSHLSIPAALGLGFLTYARKGRGWRTLCLGLIIMYGLLFLSLSTRQVIIVSLFYIFGLILGGAPRITSVLFLLLWIITLPSLAQLPLLLRGMPEQGLIPLGDNLVKIMSSDSSGGYTEEVDALVRNVTFGVPLAAYVELAQPIPKETLFISINPLPSFVPLPGLASWDSVRNQLRVNDFMPFSALGELLNQGWIWLISYYFLIGMLSAWLDVGARMFKGHRNRWGYLIGCGLLFLFSFTSTQYNLRSATRLPFYAIAVVFLWKMLCAIPLKARSNHMRTRLSLKQPAA